MTSVFRPPVLAFGDQLLLSRYGEPPARYLFRDRLNGIDLIEWGESKTRALLHGETVFATPEGQLPFHQNIIAELDLGNAVIVGDSDGGFTMAGLLPEYDEDNQRALEYIGADHRPKAMSGSWLGARWHIPRRMHSGVPPEFVIGDKYSALIVDALFPVNPPERFNVLLDRMAPGAKVVFTGLPGQHTADWVDLLIDQLGQLSAQRLVPYAGLSEWVNVLEWTIE